MIINCKMRVSTSSSKEYEMEVEQYEEHLRICELTGKKPEMPKPSKKHNYKWKDGGLYAKHLKRELTYYVEDLQTEDTITLAFIDGTTMVIKKTNEILTKLKNL